MAHQRIEFPVYYVVNARTPRKAGNLAEAFLPHQESLPQHVPFCFSAQAHATQFLASTQPPTSTAVTEHCSL